MTSDLPSGWFSLAMGLVTVISIRNSSVAFILSAVHPWIETGRADMNIGIVGIGFMGMIHFHSYQAIRGARVTAICEQIPHRLRGDWRDIKGNFGPAGGRVNLAGIATHAEVDALLEDPSLDLVDVCLPPALHADVAVKALKAGKHVFCEKPMALTEKDTVRMAQAARRARRCLMIGHVLPMFPEYRFLHRAVADQKYGRVLGGHFKRIISDPAWLTRFYDPDWIGGPMLDLHIHDAHLLRLLFGMPRSVQSHGRMRGEVAEYFETQFAFDDKSLVVSATGGVIAQPGRPFLHGYEVHFEKATVVFESGVIDDQPRTMMPLTVMTNQGKVRQLSVKDGDPTSAFRAELTAVVRSVNSGTVADFLSHSLAADAIRICQAETRSVATGRRVALK
jgi:predicted dehydrogenase